MTDAIDFPQKPVGFPDLSSCPTIAQNWDYSLERLENLRAACADKIDDPNLTVVVAGSFARMEACPLSDLDFMLLSEDGESDLSGIQDMIRGMARDFDIQLPNEAGVFSDVIPVAELVNGIGAKKETLDAVAQRLLLLMESRPIYNAAVYDRTVNSVLEKYLELVIEEPDKQAVFLLNDAMRYFRSICVNYQFTFWNEEEKWVLRNVKLRHSRLIMYAGLLLLVLNASKKADIKVEYLRKNIALTPLEKIVSVYRDNGDESAHRVVSMYEVFLKKISDPKVREALSADYNERYENAWYHELKTNSDNLQRELTRFIFERKRDWPAEIFEYLIF